MLADAEKGEADLVRLHRLRDEVADDLGVGLVAAVGDVAERVEAEFEKLCHTR